MESGVYTRTWYTRVYACVLKITPLFLPVEIQHPVRADSSILESYKLTLWSQNYGTEMLHYFIYRKQSRHSIVLDTTGMHALKVQRIFVYSAYGFIPPRTTTCQYNVLHRSFGTKAARLLIGQSENNVQTNHNAVVIFLALYLVRFVGHGMTVKATAAVSLLTAVVS